MIQIQENVALKDFTTMRVGGPARFFVSVRNKEELKEALIFAQKKSLSIFTLGGGSNTIFPDEGFQGLVIKVEIKGIQIKKEKGAPVQKVFVEVGAGEEWDAFVLWSVEQDLYGIENLSYIPGSVGATPIQNVGAYGSDVSKTIYSVSVFNADSFEEEVLFAPACDFGYRTSIFKKKKELIILSVTFCLESDGVLMVDYKDVHEYFSKKGVLPSLLDVRDAIISIRKNKLPDPKYIGTVGSYFKNPTITKKVFKKLIKKYPEIPHYLTNTGVKIPLAWILEHVCNLKGVREGDVGLYERQPLSLVNYDTASAKEIFAFAEKIKKDIKNKTEIDVEEEITLVDDE